MKKKKEEQALEAQVLAANPPKIMRSTEALGQEGEENEEDMEQERIR